MARPTSAASSAGNFDLEQERRWANERRECLIQDAIERPDYWRPIIKRWVEKGKPGIEELRQDIRAAWREKHGR